MTLKLDNQSIVDKKCIHGIEFEPSDCEITEGR